MSNSVKETATALWC